MLRAVFASWRLPSLVSSVRRSHGPWEVQKLAILHSEFREHVFPSQKIVLPPQFRRCFGRDSCSTGKRRAVCVCSGAPLVVSCYLGVVLGLMMQGLDC